MPSHPWWRRFREVVKALKALPHRLIGTERRSGDCPREPGTEPGTDPPGERGGPTASARPTSSRSGTAPTTRPPPPPSRTRWPRPMSAPSWKPGPDLEGRRRVDAAAAEGTPAARQPGLARGPDLQGEHTIIDLGKRGLVGEQQVEELNTAVAAARAKTMDARAVRDQIRGLLDSDIADPGITEAFKDSVIIQLRRQYVDLVQRADDLKRRLAPTTRRSRRSSGTFRRPSSRCAPNSSASPCPWTTITRSPRHARTA